jgi:uncharacterized protein
MPLLNLIDSELGLSKIVRSMRTVAVIGMKDERSSDQPAFEIPKMLSKWGYTVYPVNPTIASSLGETSVATLAELNHRVDVVNIFRCAENVPPIVDQILALPKERRPQVVWMQTGIRNLEAAEMLSDAGIQVVMDRCLGVYAARYKDQVT